MHQITFNFFYKADFWLARLIRWATHGPYNHVSVTVDGITYEAIGGRFNRVVMSHDPLTFHHGKYAPTKVDTLSIECNDRQKIGTLSFLRARVGKPYDVLGTLAFLWPGFKTSKKRYFCSEVAAKVVSVVTGREIKDKLITPTELYDILNQMQYDLGKTQR